MRRRFFFSVAGLAVLWAGFLWLNFHREQPGEPISPPVLPEKHYVTPRQLTASGAMANHPVAPFTAVAQDGQPVAWAELSAGQPVVFVFIKRDCPCSVDFEPFFHRVEKAYRGSVRFTGVIDGSADVARQYAKANLVPYPVLADAEQRLIGRFQAENGGYVALVTPDGMLDSLWPGCSVEMMQELSRRIAALAGLEERSVDYTGMPNALTTGCPFSS